MLHLKPNKANGPDNISTNILKLCPAFAAPLCSLYKQSIQTGTMPQDWKDANITPLFKKGQQSLANNYRPISLTSQVVKILEKIIASHIHDLLSRNKFISCDQHGFKESASCVTQLLECLNDWTKMYDRKSSTDIVYLDFAKAFDSVPHKRLILRLKLAGISGRVLRWIEGFLSGRRQRVVLRNGSSHWRQVTSGVPQGSILGPLLFLIYVNDIPELVSSTAKMFADDTKVYCHTPDLESCKYLQDDLNKLGAWSSKWLLNFNAHKCVVLKIRESLNYLYTLDGVPLKSVSSQKDLGVIISNDLKPKNHITSIVSKANQRVGLIKRCFTHLKFDLIDRLFKAIVRPILEYGSPTWSPALLCDINDLERVQKKLLSCGHRPDRGVWPRVGASNSNQPPRICRPLWGVQIYPWHV